MATGRRAQGGVCTGLRNLDIHLGMERRVVYDFVNCILEECRLEQVDAAGPEYSSYRPQALIKDRRQSNLSLLAASQVRSSPDRARLICVPHRPATSLCYLKKESKTCSISSLLTLTM